MPFPRFLHLFLRSEARVFVYVLILALCLTKMPKTKFSSPKEKEHLLGLSILSLPPKQRQRQPSHSIRSPSTLFGFIGSHQLPTLKPGDCSFSGCDYGGGSKKTHTHTHWIQPTRWDFLFDGNFILTIRILEKYVASEKSNRWKTIFRQQKTHSKFEFIQKITPKTSFVFDRH